ncbi:MAG: glycosyltransferase, partial [Patescibacteria group bacterium]
MRICYFGDYDPEYNRTRVLATGLEMTGVEVIHCNAPSDHPQKYRTLWKKLRALRDNYDLVMVPMSNGRFYTAMAQLISSRPVFWDPVFSLYDAWVYDRRLVNHFHPKALLYWLLDLLSALCSDVIVLDNDAHVAYWRKAFHISADKLTHVLIGADNKIFNPQPYPVVRDVFEVEFHGKYIPLQGTQVIVRAAKLLENDNVHFTMIGSGQESRDTQAMAEELGVSNVTFLPFIPQHEIPAYMAKAHACMGHSGDRPRVERSLPNKLYEAAAMGRVSINVNSAAIREVFTPGIDIVGTKAGDSENLARVIRELKASGKAEAMGR